LRDKAHLRSLKHLQYLAGSKRDADAKYTRSKIIFNPYHPSIVGKMAFYQSSEMVTSPQTSGRSPQAVFTREQDVPVQSAHRIVQNVFGACA